MFSARFPFPSPLATLLRVRVGPAPARLRSPRSPLVAFLALPALALTLPSAAQRKPLECARDPNFALPVPHVARVPGDEAKSIVNWSELGFGTVAGMCVGVFVKKGLKAVAFALGGVFVLMQYFSSRSFISINWSALTSSYDSLITRTSRVPTGGNRVVGLWGTFVDFVTADVQSRATFVAGMLLGLRIG